MKKIIARIVLMLICGSFFAFTGYIFFAKMIIKKNYELTIIDKTDEIVGKHSTRYQAIKASTKDGRIVELPVFSLSKYNIGDTIHQDLSETDFCGKEGMINSIYTIVGLIFPAICITGILILIGYGILKLIEISDIKLEE